MKNNILESIDCLQETSTCYYVDFLPLRMESDRYFELEEFLLKNYLSCFSEKIIRIVLKIIGYYPSKIFMTELPNGYKGSDDITYPIGEDISSLSMNNISILISHIIQDDVSSLQILFGNSFTSLISINGAFSVDFYNLTDEKRVLLNELISQEGLFLRKTE